MAEIERNDFVTTLPAEETYIFPEEEDVRNNLKKWQSDKFGILIHFGLYSVPGIVESWALCPEDEEWIGRYGYVDYFSFAKYYRGLKKKFNPVNMNTEKWVKAIKKSGAKYLIFSTKHHDGFCLFDSKYSDFKVTDKECPFSNNQKSNIFKEVTESARREGLSVGAYFSKPDWTSEYFWWKYFPPKDRNPNYNIQKHPDRWKKFIEYTYNQVDELVTDYGNLDILWFDGCWVRPLSTMNKQVEEFCKYPYDLDLNMKLTAENARKKQPGILIVDRWVPGLYENYLTPEQKIPERPLKVPWESCLTMSSDWGWTPNAKYKSTKEIIQLLIKITAKGGNLLLGIGPNGTGEFDPEVYSRLDEIGKWLEKNGCAIFGTQPVGPYQEGNIAYTKKSDNEMCAFYLPDSADGFFREKILLKIKNRNNLKINLMHNNYEPAFEEVADGINILIPEGMWKDLSCEPAIAIKISNL
jgi:alpha-L-fucosidase